MTRLRGPWLLLGMLTFGCAPPALSELSPDQQRALGEAAVARVCGYELDVESSIGSDHRANLNLARQYLDDVVPTDVGDGQLSEYFSASTIERCGADLEWGGVNLDVQRLVRRRGTEAEVRALLAGSRSPDRRCRFSGDPEGVAFVATCRALGFAE